MTIRHLLSVEDLGPAGIEEILQLTDSFVEVSERAIPRVPALRGKTVVSLFFEDSTRTRLSFETAAKRLSADTMTFSVSTSSLNKGESLRDTVETIEAMGIDAVVVRHSGSGVPWQVAGWLHGPSVINAGDGWHEHPTQALFDCYTIRQERERRRPRRTGPRPLALEALHIAIVGDIRHSRVARSDVLAFTSLGARVTRWPHRRCCRRAWPAGRSRSRTTSMPYCPSWMWSTCSGCSGNACRRRCSRPSASTPPPTGSPATGPGLLADGAADHAPGSGQPGRGDRRRGRRPARAPVITQQVANGVAVRMAVLYLLLGSGVDLVAA